MHRDEESFRCFYTASKCKSESKMFSKTKRKKISMIKNSIACPFLVRFSIPGIKKKNLPPISREVKITPVVPHNSCGLCNQSFRAVNRMSKV